MDSIPITIIIPVYNGERYIDRCMRNILSDPYKALEIVTIDDGSKDDSGLILDSWANKDSRVHVLHTKNNGVSSARNIGIEYAANYTSGMYYHFFDIDDKIIIGSYTEIMTKIEKLASYPDIIVFGYTTILCDIYGNVIRREDNNPPLEEELIEEELKDRYFEYYGIRKGIRNSACNKLFKASTCKDVLFRTDLKQAEDLFFNIDVLAKAKSIYLIPRAYYLYYKVSTGKNYYDDDVQMAFDRNKEICNKLIRMGVNKEEALNEYYHKILDTAYDNCMLVLRNKTSNSQKTIDDSLTKLGKLDIPKKLRNITLQQRSILIAKKMKLSYMRYAFLNTVKLASRIIWIGKYMLNRVKKKIAHKPCVSE